MRAAQKYLVLFACLGLACSTGGSPTYPIVDLSGNAADLGIVPGMDLAGADLQGADLATPPPPRDLAPPPPDLDGVDLAGTVPDLAVKPADLAMTPPDLSMAPPDLATPGSCSPGSYRCAPANAVEVCNVTGSAWLHVSTCAVSCSAGLCTGACTPGSRRCNMKSVEECNTAGTTWSTVDTCAGSCSSGVCALSSLDVTMNKNLDGEIVVDGDFTVRSGVTVTSTSGELTVRARNITIENMGTITVSPHGNAYGRGNGGGPNPTYTNYGGGGGGNGTAGTADSVGTSYGGAGGAALPSDTDAIVQGGGNGGSANGVGGGFGGAGGGVIRLIASDSITVAGYLTANGTAGSANTTSAVGGGGGGAGGGILLAATGKVTVTGAVSASGGAGGKGYYSTAGSGGQGRVRILAGDTRTVTGTISGAVRTDGILPPMIITSSSHPDPSLVYNDDCDSISLSWTSPFSSRQGYYHLINTTNFQVPTPATGTFVNTEAVSYMPTVVSNGNNYFHIASVDALTNVGKVENNFLIQVNTIPPTVSSSSHPSATTWYTNHDVFYQWSFPVADPSVKGVYYVLDNYGTTIPTKAATLVLMPQKNLLRASVPDGIWVMHVLSVDTHDYLTKAASHYKVQLGADPGSGTLLGQVTDSMGKAIDGATVTVNRGLWTQTTNTTGNYNYATVTAGTYELRVTKTGRTPAVQMITVTKGGSTTANVTMP